MFNYFYENFMWNFSCVNPLAHKENKEHMTLIDCRKECMQNERNCSPAWKCSVFGINVTLKCPKSTVFAQ